MPKAGDIKYCDLLGGRKTNAAFVYVPPSAFWMGDASSDFFYPVHLVVVSKGFWIQQTVLTNAQYEYFHSVDNTAKSAEYRKPKIDISWNDVTNLVFNKPLRLPTEAEWELAARAGAGHKYLFSGSNIANNVAWMKDNVRIRRVQPVANLKSNTLGLFDMSGNVWEWCHDWASYLTSIPQIDPQGPGSSDRRVLHGGSWGTDPQKVQVAHRDSDTPAYQDNLIGVRLIWEI